MLTSHGLDVLLLEAGRQVDFEAEVNSMEWPYQHPRRGKLAPDTYVLNEATTSGSSRPTRRRSAATPTWRAGSSSARVPTTPRTSSSTRRSTPTPAPITRGCARACLGGKTNIWGRLALRLSDYDFKAKSHDGYGEDWPISYADIAPYYDQVDRYLGISGVKENLPHLPDSIFQRPTRLNAAEVQLRETLKKMGRVLTPYRAGVTTEGLKHNKYRSAASAAARAPPRRRLRHPRGVRLADRPDLSGDGHRAT